MQEALIMLSHLSQEDISWILEKGTEQQIIAETIIIEEGRHPDSLFIILDGLVRVEITSAENHPVAVLGPGELLGEMSFLDGKPASATVKAIENTLLLVISRQFLQNKLDTEPEFAARFYRSCAILAAGRLRNKTGAVRLHLAEKLQQEEAFYDVWQPISQAIEGMKVLLKCADEAAIRNFDEVPTERAEEIRSIFKRFMHDVNKSIGDSCGLNETVREELGRRLQREILPYLLLTNTPERCYAKPRGYAGDFLTIDWIYRNEAKGSGRLGILLDRCFLDMAAAQAVRNRRVLLAELIGNAIAIAESAGRTARITSMACGPAAEIFDSFGTLSKPGQMHATLLDIDIQALAFVNEKASRLNLLRHVELVNSNLVYLATGRQKLNVPEQDLMYSIGLIDYFSDKFVISLLNFVHSKLRPGGKVVLGNFHPKNPDKAMMDYILEWRLIHRSEDDMNRLFKASHFSSICTDIRFEEAGVNLFAECIKKE